MSFLLSNMMGVCLSAIPVLNVLRTIGLVALIVLLVIVALIVCVLFVPVRYRAKGNIDEMTFQVRLHWFLKIIQFSFSYKDGSTDYALCLFGIRTKLLDKEAMERRKRRRERRKARKAARKYKSRKKKYQKEHDKYKEQFLREQVLEEGVKASFEQGDSSEGRVDAKMDESQSNTSGSTQQSGPEKAMAMAKKAVHILKTIQEHQPVRLLWNDILRFLNHARPKRVVGEITFGLEDPSTTGQVLGAISNLYFLYEYNKLHIYPDFETDKSYITGHVDIKGYIQALFALIFVIRVMRKKQFRRFLKVLDL